MFVTEVILVIPLLMHLDIVAIPPPVIALALLLVGRKVVDSPSLDLSLHA